MFPRRLPSRNRNFFAYETSEGRRLLRSERLLQSIEQDLLAFGLVHGFRLDHERERGRYCITVNLEASPVRYRRRSFLSETELAYLKSNPLLADLLAAGAWRM